LTSQNVTQIYNDQIDNNMIASKKNENNFADDSVVWLTDENSSFNKLNIQIKDELNFKMDDKIKI
jgi:hypothetical protein